LARPLLQIPKKELRFVLGKAANPLKVPHRRFNEPAMKGVGVERNLYFGDYSNSVKSNIA
jgi:hypothetical protein